MAPRRKTIGSLRGSFTTILGKENGYLRSLSDYQARVRRRESIRNYRNAAEHDLERKIELETKIKEGSSKLLAAARHPTQCLEAARALFTSSKRMSIYMAELHKKRNREPSKTGNSNSKGKLCISDLRFPLMWRDSDHFKNRGDSRKFAVFCIVRVGTEIQDTGLIYPIDREQTDISFPDVLLFNNVPAEFELTLEVYSHVLQDDLGIASTPRRIRRTIHSSISKTMGRKFAAVLRDEYESNKVPRFDLVAHAKMNLDDTNEGIRSHDLMLNGCESKVQALPLFGHFCCRLAVQPNYIDKEVCTGCIIVNNKACRARLQAFQIESTWESTKHNELETPIYRIPVDKDTVIRRSKSTANQLHIINYVDGKEKNDVVTLNTSEDTQNWFERLTECIEEHAKWKHAATNLQQIPNSDKCSSTNTSICDPLEGKDKKQGSLYDETSLTELTFPSSLSRTTSSESDSTMPNF